MLKVEQKITPNTKMSYETISVLRIPLSKSRYMIIDFEIDDLGDCYYGSDLCADLMSIRLYNDNTPSFRTIRTIHVDKLKPNNYIRLSDLCLKAYKNYREEEEV